MMYGVAYGLYGEEKIIKLLYPVHIYIISFSNHHFHIIYTGVTFFKKEPASLPCLKTASIKSKYFITS